MKRQYRYTFEDFGRELERFSKKMTYYREEFLKLMRDPDPEDPDAVAVATRLLDASPAGVGTLEIYPQMLGQTLKSAMTRFK